VYVNSSETIDAAAAVLFDRTGDHIRIDSAQNATVLLLAGEPLNEPIVGSGPFVMNNDEEIRQAILDYQNGKMGSMP
jgi:quercetin 2,3-dioxygenase